MAKTAGSIELAFLGDAEFTRYVRRRLIGESDGKSGQLTRAANRLVSAVYQSAYFTAIADELNEEEAAVARRARNAHTPAHAKNAGLGDYKRATALEAVFGWLSLEGDFKRLDGLMEKCYELGKIRLDEAK